VKPVEAAPGAAKARPFPVSAKKKKFFHEHKRKFYGLLALLILWLTARLLSGPEQVEARRPPTRHSPVSAEELGRTVFAVARGEDFDAYRVLYLSGSEAIQVLGPSEGQRYIGRRTFEALQAAFELLVEQVPHGTVYVSTELRNTGQCVMTVRNASDERRAVPLGSVAQVGAVMRIVEPGIGPVPSEPMPFLDDDSITELKA
jgi:hypothetical protein